MLPYANPELFRNDSVAKSLTITYTGGQFTNSDLISESFEMTESINTDEQIQFGECSSTMVKFQTFANNIYESMVGKVLTISITPSGGASVPLGIFKVASDEPSADLKIRTITAYDSMADIFNTELATWYEGLFPNEGDTLTCLQFRNSLFTYLGIEQESISLINDSVVIEKTITTTSLSGRDVLYCICQLNGVFGKIGRDGKFKYLSVEPVGEEALYPSEELYPADDLYPSDGTAGQTPEEIPTGTYISCQYENYVTDAIDKVQIRMKENDIGCIVGSGTNAFIIENNFLLFGKSTEDLTPIATAIYNKISGVLFRPVTMTVVGNPLREIGDGLRLETKYVTIDTYVLSRKLKGIQSLRDDISANSTKERDESLTDTHHELMQLLGKSNLLERTIEQTQSTITDVASGLQSQITQNAQQIALKVTKGTVSSELSVESGQVKIESNRFILKSTNCEIDADGTLRCKSANITGGSIEITTSSSSSNVIRLMYGSDYCYLSPVSLEVHGYNGSTKVQGSTIYTPQICGQTLSSDLTLGGSGDVIIAPSSGKALKVNRASEFSHTVTIKTSQINFTNAGTAYGIQFGGNQAIGLYDSLGGVYIGRGTSSQTVCLGNSSSKVGFFGGSGNTKQTVNKLSTSATEANIITKVNDLLTALKNYGLITSS